MKLNDSILVFGTPFFGYINRVVEHLEKRDISVDMRLTFADDLYSRFLRWSKQIITEQSYLNYKNSYYSRILTTLKPDYDTVLIINGGTLPLSVLLQLKEKYPTSRFILYIWDDMHRINHNTTFLNCFDTIYTYSKLDALKFQFIFRPFFYSENFQNDKLFDLSFIGTLHSNRLHTLKSIQKQNPELIISNYIYSDLISFFKNRSQSGANIADVHFKKLSFKDYIKKLSLSKVTIELPIDNQNNITTRAIEVLGTKTKLLTTSSSVKDYDFYDENNILIFEKQEIPVLKEWIEIPYKEYSKEILNYYSIESWLDDIFRRK